MQTWDAITSRRNVRSFADRPIAAADLDQILEAGRRAPSSQNWQPWDFVVVTDRDRCNVVDVGILIAKTLHHLYPAKFDLEKLDHLLGHRATLEAIKAGKDLSEIKLMWANDLKQFNERRAAHLLYK